MKKDERISEVRRCCVTFPIFYILFKPNAGPVFFSFFWAAFQYVAEKTAASGEKTARTVENLKVLSKRLQNIYLFVL